MITTKTALDSLYEIRPIGDDWPGPLTENRPNTPFKSEFRATLGVLREELALLKAEVVVVQLDVDASQIRVDGSLRAHAQVGHPGVILSFESIHGPLRYPCDAFDVLWGSRAGWKENLRAIALGLHDLRRLNRYGISQRGEQYTGFSALPPGTTAGAGSVMTVDEARAFMAEHAPGDWDFTDGYEIGVAYRHAAKTLHPDHGGSSEAFRRLQDAKAALDRAYGS